MREHGGSASAPSPQTRRSHQRGPASNAHVDETHGQAATKDARSLSRLPYQHSQWTTRHICHGIVTGEPGDRKAVTPGSGGGRWKRTARHLARVLPRLSSILPSASVSSRYAVISPTR